MFPNSKPGSLAQNNERIPNRGMLMAVAVVSLFAGGQAALAAPVPATEEELNNDTDLIVEVLVESVTRIGSVNNPNCVAQLRILRTLKGRAPSKFLPHSFFLPELPVIGAVDLDVYPGQRWRFYMIRNRYGRYVLYSWNAGKLLESIPAERKVHPQQVGETILRDGTRVVPRQRLRCRSHYRNRYHRRRRN